MASALARAYRDAGRYADALTVYARLLNDDPLDRHVHEGLLLAAAGTGDPVHVREAWEQICVCTGDEPDPETRGLYERLAREMGHAPTSVLKGVVATGSGSG